MPVLTAGTKRVLYIHVPKTGGTWVEELMRSYGTVSGVKHGKEFGGLPCSPQHFHGELLTSVYSTSVVGDQDDFDYVFMTVRDPIERLKSEYRYRRPFGSFHNWVLATLNAYEKDSFVLDNHIRPQVEFEAFGPAVFRLEDGLDAIRVLLDVVVEASGTAPDKPLNTTKGDWDYATLGEARKRLLAHTVRDMEVYGYDRHSSP